MKSKERTHLFEVPVEHYPTEKGAIDPIEEMVGALFDPIIVFPSPWQETIPEKLKQELPLRRLAHQMLCLKGDASWDEACDLEALIYLYPASLEAPMDHHWANIYLYLGTKCYGSSFPEDIRKEGLDSHESGMLRDLKCWLRKKKLEARKEKARKRKTEQQSQQPQTDKVVEAHY